MIATNFTAETHLLTDDVRSDEDADVDMDVDVDMDMDMGVDANMDANLDANMDSHLTASTINNYDVYIVVNPSGNTIGRATADRLVGRFSSSSSSLDHGEFFISEDGSQSEIKTTDSSAVSDARPKTETKSKTKTNTVICLVCCPPLPEPSEARTGTAAALQPVGDSVRFLSDTTYLSFDPFGDGPAIRASAEECLNRIAATLCAHQAESNTNTNTNTNKKTTSATTTRRQNVRIRIRGIVLNPYGCCPEVLDRRNVDARTSPLAEFKLLSNAIFVDAALARRNTVVSLRGVEGDVKGDTKHECKYECDATVVPSLRVVVVGTEAARGLPRMGIPVPDLQQEVEDESSIRNRLLLAPKQQMQMKMQQPMPHSDEPTTATKNAGASWESEYAEMNAMSVLYFKALAASLSEQNDKNKNCCVGIVSPGMTEESMKLEHVPGSGRTLAFRAKLWLCRLPRVFAWLRAQEIAKTSDEGGALLVRALLNDPIEEGDAHRNTNHKVRNSSSDGNGNGNDETVLRWDDVYPTGFFVGAKSGTGGPLCEQALLVYNSTSGRVGLVDENTNDHDDETTLGNRHGNEREGKDRGTNFLGNRGLQRLVFNAVQEFM